MTKESKSCSNGFHCDGSEDLALMFHAVTAIPSDVAWTSTAIKKAPYYMGKSSYFATNRNAAFVKDNVVYALQRPALPNIHVL